MLTACQKKGVEIDYSGPIAGWDEVTGSKGGGQFSPLTQIDRANVSKLQVAWTYQSPDFAAAGGDVASAHASSMVETTPLIANGKMILCTPTHHVVALDPNSGKELWNYDPHMDVSAPSHFCRGVTVWHSSQPQSGKSCEHRIFSTSGDGRLISLDLDRGTLCPEFGSGGAVDMKQGLGPLKPNEYYNTSPPLVVNDLVIAGHAIRDGFRNDTGGGVIRAWDVHTGRLVWAWDPVGPGMTAVSAEDSLQGAVFTRGTPNVWTFLSADIENDLLYLATGNAPSDHFKGPERAIDTYGSSIVGLHASTGKIAWAFQTVHHDLWDYDIGAQPVLYLHDGKTPALAVGTKQGHIFLLNRLTGEPLFPVEERPVPQTDVPGEWTSPTQPFPTLPKPLLGAKITADDLLSVPFLSKGCREAFDASRNEGPFTPPSLRGTLQSPGISGGFNWGSGSINPASGVYVATYLHMPFIVKLVPRSKQGKAEDDNDPVNWADLPQYQTPYELKRVPFLSQHGVPCTKPPWGNIVAIDLHTGLKLWQKPLGSMRSRVPLIGSLLNVGVPGAGGTLQTASGLVFVAASADETMRAFNSQTGETMWSFHLPFSAHATPMTYRLSERGKQYLVIATGGTSMMDAKVGNTLTAFTLPDSR
jgi:quinoprotein glucose dehydrogenase